MSSTWRISKGSYYADWVTIPIIGILALVADVLYHGFTWLSPIMFVLGALAMSFVEYGVHRWVLHEPKLLRNAHWPHHIRPAAYVGVPSWQTAIYFVLLLLASWGWGGFDLGSSFFVGFCTYYLTYIFVHDRFHHGNLGLIKAGYWRDRRKAHLLHHAYGREINFGVASPLWDMLLGTYCRPYPR